MPNGSGLTQQEYDTLDVFMKSMDGLVEKYALSINAKFTTGYHGMPDRRISWKGIDTIMRSISISPRFLDKELRVADKPLCLISVAAWKDSPETIDIDYLLDKHQVSRKSWHKKVGFLNQSELDPRRMKVLLEKSRCIVDRITERELLPCS